MTGAHTWIRRAVEALAAVAAGVQLALIVIYWRVMTHELHMNDFGKFYYSARAFLDGLDMYGPTLATAVPFGPDQTREFLNMNPPHFHLLVLPLAVLAPSHAVAVWLAAGFFCLLMSVLVIARELSIEWTPRNVYLAAIAVLLPSSTGMVVLTGQVTFVLMLPVTLAWIAMRRGHWSAAAIHLGLAASVKPFLVIFCLALLLTRRFRAAAVMAGVAAISTVVGLMVFGVGSYRSWLAAIASVDWVWSPMNASLAALVARTFAPNPTFLLLADVPELSAVALATLSTAILIYAYWRFRPAGPPASVDVAFAGLTLTALLISPLGWMYYIALIAGPAVAVFRSRSRTLAGVWAVCLTVAAPGLLLPPFPTGAWAHLPWGGLTLGSIYTWACLALWTLAALEAARARRERVEARTAIT